ncbi:MAG: methyltransferase domain-containing protein [Solirubrobacteraceae bacterium]|jgi:SAM-dependent methyltransferase
MVYKRDTQWQGYGQMSRERVFDNGRKRVTSLAAAIEAHTGSALESRRALDFGCGVGRVALPLAERCEHVYGLDVSPSVLREADSNARRMNLTNVEWVDAGRLAELSGCYDLVLSLHVFQHIPARKGERIFATLVRGLRPGGVGFINLILRPSHPLARLFRWTWRSPRAARPRRKSVRSAYNPLSLVRVWDLSYLYMLMNSYSLNRLGRLLADAGVTDWHVQFNPGPTGRSFDAVAIIFRKD